MRTEAPGRFSTTMVAPNAGPSSLLTVRASTSSVQPAGTGTMKRICLLAGTPGAGAWASAGAADNAIMLKIRTRFNDMMSPLVG